MGAAAHASRVRTAASVVESSRREEDAGDEHLAYSPSTGTGSVATVSTGTGVVSGEDQNGADTGARW